MENFILASQMFSKRSTKKSIKLKFPHGEELIFILERGVRCVKKHMILTCKWCLIWLSIILIIASIVCLIFEEYVTLIVACIAALVSCVITVFIEFIVCVIRKHRNALNKN